MQNAAFTGLEAKSWMSHTRSAALFGERELQGTVAQGQYIPAAVRAGWMWPITHHVSLVPDPGIVSLLLAWLPVPLLTSPTPRAEPWDPAVPPHPGHTTSCLALLEQSPWDVMLGTGQGVV